MSINANDAEKLWRARESSLENYLNPIKGAILARIDGRAFHTLTRNMRKPFDNRMTEAMDAAALCIATSVPGVIATYTQSDEISVIIINHSKSAAEKPYEGYPFSGRVEKLASILASAATAGFAKTFPDTPTPALFDGRVFIAMNIDEIKDYLMWRIADSKNNAISATAVATFGHKPVLNISAKQRASMLAEANITIDNNMFYGRLLTKELVRKTTTWTDKNNQPHTVECDRHIWSSYAATPNKIDRLIDTIHNLQEIR